MLQSEELLGRIFRPLLKTRFSFMKSVLKTLAKRVLVPLELTTPASAVIKRKLWVL